MDQKGYVMTGMSFLLIIPIFVLFMVLIDINHANTESKSLIIKSDNVLQISRDLEYNIPRVGRQALKEEAYGVIRSRKPLVNSKKTVKENIQLKMDKITQNYNKDGLKVIYAVRSLKESEDPFLIEINSTIIIVKDNLVHEQYLDQNISLYDPKDPLPDPMPFVKCQNYGGVTINGSRICYGHSLVSYLKSRGEINSEVYENATSPLFIKKCPYDPFKAHGDTKNLDTLKNCIDNGYYHESNDAACYLCRLEGKSTCYHQGMEIFIVPAPQRNVSFFKAPCSVDHVIFSDNSTTIYPGGSLQYYVKGSLIFQLFLDDSHRKKYGLPPI
ncbi:MAG TPA: hypothetical protein VK444_01885 [Methanobacteriaceae archaeon]|nr:hypothetical protein [Methanobacteriaceae archaeon]